MGLGFGFQAKDQGLLGFQKKASAGFVSMSGALGTLTSMAESFSATGMNMTTQLEAFRIRGDASARAAAANAGFVGEAFNAIRKRAVSAAEGLNLSIKATTDSSIAFEDAKGALGDLGVGYITFTKFSRQVGLNARQFGEDLRQLKQDFKLNKEEMKEMEGVLISTGSANRDIGGQTKFFHQQMGILQRVQALNRGEAFKFGKSILHASGMLRVYGVSTEEARSISA